MNQKKVVSQKVTVGIAILCVVLLIGFAEAVVNYNSLLNVEDTITSEKNLEIGNQTSQISNLQESVDGKQSENDYLTSQIAQKNSTISDLIKQISQKDS
jgi:septal ring factor EnvC (AmiA/AmiB activator)